MTSAQIKSIRNAVYQTRATRTKEAIQRKINWSRQSSQRNWLSRSLWNLPDHEYSEAESLKILETEAINWWGSLNSIEYVGETVLNLCNAVEASERLGLPLKLTAEEVNLLDDWCKE